MAVQTPEIDVVDHASQIVGNRGKLVSQDDISNNLIVATRQVIVERMEEEKAFVAAVLDNAHTSGGGTFSLSLSNPEGSGTTAVMQNIAVSTTQTAIVRVFVIVARSTSETT